MSTHLFQRVRRATITEAANEPIDGRVLAEGAHTRREYDELALVGDGHARAIDGLVAEPRRFEFERIEIDNDFLWSTLEAIEVHLPTQRRTAFETGAIVAGVDAARHQLAVG